jgi:hypothetical protein
MKSVLRFTLVISSLLYCTCCFSQKTVTNKAETRTNQNKGPIYLWIKKGHGDWCRGFGICFIAGDPPQGPHCPLNKAAATDTTTNNEGFDAWATLAGKKLSIVFYYPLERSKTLIVDKKIACTACMNSFFGINDAFILPGNYQISYYSNGLATVKLNVEYK